MIARLQLATFALIVSSLAANAGTRSFILPDNDGYGLAECLIEGSSCGRIVADAWCESQGLGRSTEFGRADPTDITASLKSASAGFSGAAASFIVTCAE
jgi:hypothetical protein